MPPLANPTALYEAIDEFARHYESEAIDVIAAVEACGFIPPLLLDIDYKLAMFLSI